MRPRGPLEVLFEDGLYQVIGREAVAAAQTPFRDCLVANGYELCRSFGDHLVRLNIVLSDKVHMRPGNWLRLCRARLTTAWSTRPEQVTALRIIAQHPALKS